jgi:hypothetical protein
MAFGLVGTVYFRRALDELNAKPFDRADHVVIQVTYPPVVAICDLTLEKHVEDERNYPSQAMGLEIGNTTKIAPL